VADTPDSRRVVSATEFVAQLRADQNMLNFSNCIIEGDVELRSVRFSHPLIIRNTHLKGHVDAVDARFERSVEMSQCRFEGGINLRGAR